MLNAMFVGAGFYISNAGRQTIPTITATYFQTAAELRAAGTNGYLAIGEQQWGIWNDNRSAGQIQCTFPVSNTKETLAILATYFDNTYVSNGAILIKETTLSTCKIKLWSYTKISFWGLDISLTIQYPIAVQNLFMLAEPKVIYVIVFALT